MSEGLFDCLGRRRSPAATSAFHTGRPPGNRGLRYPADPPPVEEIITVMRAAGDGAYGDRLRGMIVVLWRAGLRIGEALALAETDLDRSRGAILIRAGKGGKRREVGMDDFGWQRLDPWLERRRTLPVGALFCILHGPTRGRPWAASAVPTSCAGRPLRLGFVGGWRHISSGMRTRSSWRTRACRWS
jgi:integrase